MPRRPPWPPTGPRSRRSRPWLCGSATASGFAGSADPLAVHPFLDHPGPIAFAHRGGAGNAPENSLAAFAAAIALGYRYVETDVHATADGVLVAFHDDRLDRVTDARGVVAELSWSEVRRARIEGSEPILPFEELLDAWPDVRINVDPKHDAAVAPLLALIAARGAADRVCVGSFDSSRVRAARDAFGEAGCTALTRVEVARLWVKSRSVIASTAGRFRPTAPHGTARGGRCAQVPTRLGPVGLVDRPFLERAHRSGLPVHVWTVDHPDEMRRLLDLGVDGLMSDQPAVLRSVLESRGQWVRTVHTQPAPSPAGTIHR